MQHRILKKYATKLAESDAIAAIVPDRVFRNEDLDARHEHTFYQVEGVYVAKGVHAGMLVATLQKFLEEYYGRTLHAVSYTHLDVYKRQDTTPIVMTSTVSARPTYSAPVSLTDSSATTVRMNVPTSSANTMLTILLGSTVARERADTASAFTTGFGSAFTVRIVVLAAAGFLAVAFFVEAAFLVAIDLFPPLIEI